MGKENFQDFQKYIAETAPEDQITGKELAHKYGVSEATIYNWRKKIVKVAFDLTSRDNDFYADAWAEVPDDTQNRVVKLLEQQCNCKEISKITGIDRNVVLWFRGQWVKKEKPLPEGIAIPKETAQELQTEQPDAATTRERCLQELGKRKDLSCLPTTLLVKTILVLTGIINKEGAT